VLKSGSRSLLVSGTIAVCPPIDSIGEMAMTIEKRIGYEQEDQDEAESGKGRRDPEDVWVAVLSSKVASGDSANDC
jgi:hypothetical protein